ncbi:hypothetical protein AMECASPLE_037578 [Ameca splendens]|uniref:Uncharacterized protein n=1 Tax=Ameca splendens TaxID=208324 RepID=A0ABV0Z5T6_9TELE
MSALVTAESGSESLVRPSCRVGGPMTAPVTVQVKLLASTAENPAAVSNPDQAKDPSAGSPTETWVWSAFKSIQSMVVMVSLYKVQLSPLVQSDLENPTAAQEAISYV